ncbi:unnamed protein product [Spirodela intermedia]|uniref:CRIB domain-containing protein n=1 Tax=Spirodela intermedia TaxID=51605 RepID=A0A7I8JSW3_SPIIN|nr:unnamed protein product [Spirodela intermedia]CAA6673268.1 unnamed protein product [Spirodela intermedia]
MSMKMKGLLKGLRHISHIFDAKEQEMQIGYPTDVKHVAHIGWDGASLNSPSWMNEFHSAPLATEPAADPPPLFPMPGSYDPVHHGGWNQDSAHPPALAKPLRCGSSSAAAVVDSPTRRNPHRRKQPSAAVAVDSPSREPSSTRRRAPREAAAKPSRGLSSPTPPTRPGRTSLWYPELPARRSPWQRVTGGRPGLGSHRRMARDGNAGGGRRR